MSTPPGFEPGGPPLTVLGCWSTRLLRQGKIIHILDYYTVLQYNFQISSGSLVFLLRKQPLLDPTSCYSSSGTINTAVSPTLSPCFARLRAIAGAMAVALRGATKGPPTRTLAATIQTPLLSLRSVALAGYLPYYSRSTRAWRSRHSELYTRPGCLLCKEVEIYPKSSTIEAKYASYDTSTSIMRLETKMGLSWRTPTEQRCRQAVHIYMCVRAYSMTAAVTHHETQTPKNAQTTCTHRNVPKNYCACATNRRRCLAVLFISSPWAGEVADDLDLQIGCL